MYRIAICDDERGELEKIERILQNYQREHEEYVFAVECFESADSLLDMVKNRDYMPDLLFLDIYMPEKLGTEVAKELREMEMEGRIVFLTASVDHALEAFRVGAIQYLVKPVLEKDLFLILNRFLSEIEKERKKYLLLRIEGKICRVALQDILYCEAKGKQQYLYLADGTRSLLRLTMAEIYRMLSEDLRFVKVGVSYIVNLEYVGSLNARELQLDSGEVLYLPRGAYRLLKEQYFQYYCRKEIQNDFGGNTDSGYISQYDRDNCL